jgi:hypothetical protein
MELRLLALKSHQSATNICSKAIKNYLTQEGALGLTIADSITPGGTIGD